ncbi:hypothetical protein PDG61_20840 [Mycolicibacterium sp. BiH015]|uniref:hypothetical protein n=1 Tax=Mycolicibacterium sp. BiH015 TaxID=3018808 RepID=UPI0022E23005|nr:hypothetical protein [Mycolicibacterium sp. BiH015]MDA2893374.1 hypothetical protein [Mycolicibacterium sp. BiH015]
MTHSAAAVHTTPPATITHTTAVLIGELHSDIAVYHAQTTDARIGLIFGTTLMTFYSAAAVQGLLEAFAAARGASTRIPRRIAAPNTAAAPEPFARTTLAVEWTRRPAYCVVPQTGTTKAGATAVHWIDLHCGPLTFQIRDHIALTSTLLLLTRTHKTATAVFLDGARHTADPTRDDYRPQ